MRKTPLLLEGVSPDLISVGFLVDMMDVAEEIILEMVHDLPIREVRRED